MRAALLAGAATLAGGCISGCGSAKKDVKQGDGKGDDTVLVQDGDSKLTEDERLQRQQEEMERRRGTDRQPDMPYGCVWPDDEAHV